MFTSDVNNHNIKRFQYQFQIKFYFHHCDKEKYLFTLLCIIQIYFQAVFKK